jgi:hypothetical protein
MASPAPTVTSSVILRPKRSARPVTGSAPSDASRMMASPTPRSVPTARPGRRGLRRGSPGRTRGPRRPGRPRRRTARTPRRRRRQPPRPRPGRSSGATATRPAEVPGPCPDQRSMPPALSITCPCGIPWRRGGRPRRCAGLCDWHQCHRQCAEEVPRQAGEARQDHAEVRLGTFYLKSSRAPACHGNGPPGRSRPSAQKPRYVRQLRLRTHDRELYRTAAMRASASPAPITNRYGCRLPEATARADAAAL